jgi:hypothetical protein
MGCLLVLMAGIFPRFALFIVWVARPVLVDRAFASWIWPLLGLIFLPFATLRYVILWQAGGLSGWDWFWVGFAALLDLGHWGAGAAQRRSQGRPASSAV